MKSFHLGAISGAAAVNTNGVVFAWRAQAAWQYIQRFVFTMEAIAAPTGSLSLQLEAALQDVMSADYTGGTAIGGSADGAIAARERDVQHILQATQIPVSQSVSGNIRIATTAALGGGGGGTPRTQPWAHAGLFIPLSTTPAQLSPIVLSWENPTLGLRHEDPIQGCMILAPDTGFVVRVPAFTADLTFSYRLSASVDWIE